jgi:hypothetical protein
MPLPLSEEGERSANNRGKIEREREKNKIVEEGGINK